MEAAIKRYTATKAPQRKSLIVYLEGALINFSANIVELSPEAERQARSPVHVEPGCRAHMFIPVPTTRDSKKTFFEIFTRPEAQWFIQVCSTRFDMYLVHSYPENVVRKIRKVIDPEDRIENFIYLDGNTRLTMANLMKAMKCATFPYKSTVIVSPYICYDQEVKDNMYTIPIYEYAEKDSELRSLTLLFEYLAVEEDVRPLRLRLHSYPTGRSNTLNEGLVETDNDIMNMFYPKKKAVLTGGTTENSFQTDENRSKSGISRGDLAPSELSKSQANTNINSQKAE
jgi:NLI interacting factor-like phosphatase